MQICSSCSKGLRLGKHIGHMSVGIDMRSCGTSLQIRFFYPELDHPAFGVMRAIAKDGTDTESGSSAVVFLDSDNMVGLH